MKYKIILGFFLCFAMILTGKAQEVQHISKLEIGKKSKKNIDNRDSTVAIHIDTLIMKDNSTFSFYGKKNVKLSIGYAEIGNKATIHGTDGKNNGTNFDIKANFQKLGSLYIIAKGDDAFNGTKTFPNGNGGKVKVTLTNGSLKPQTTDKKATNYIYADVVAGGRAVNANSDLRNIYDRIKTAPTGLRGLPQGQIFSGSPGTEGTFELISTQ
ncbi:MULTISPECIES: hypothetical protein [unclassified Sphingobacterium]|uniref:hypothetical protein n=1 Tax=unclassified Sphingobacterium TaxID=2609468 RepID=UPI0025F16977|nr:hypothetical protein [Sphingobacterium sp.]